MYTVPSTLVTGTTIEVGPLNGNFSDLGSEISNSLAADGQSQMSGQFKAASGSVGVPGIAFGADTDSGAYRIGGDNIGIACAGAKVLDISTSGLGVTGTLSATGALSVASITTTADLPITEGGTGQSTATAAFNALSPQTTRGDLITRDATNDVRLAVGAADTLLKSDGTDPSYGRLVNANITDTTIAHGKLATAVTASQAVMETGTAVDSFVSPGRQHFHPGHPKAWAYITGGGTPVLTSSYNITGITDDGAGLCTVTIATDFSSANWAGVATVENDDNDLATGEAAGVYITTKAAGSCQLVGEDGDEDGASSDRADWFACSFVAFGDQA